MRVTLFRLAAGLFLLAAFAPAQILVSASASTPTRASAARLDNLQVLGGVSIALPPVPHATVFWNMASLGFDRVAGHNGGSLETGLEAWVSPARRPALSYAPILLGETSVGRRWGLGLHGYSTLGLGAGWSLGSWVPYLEWRRRASFHSGFPVSHAWVLGIHYVVFG